MTCGAEDAKFGPSTPEQNAPNLVLALRLMRMVACCCGRPGFPQSSGMLLRWVHLMRHILAGCPVTRVCLPPL